MPTQLDDNPSCEKKELSFIVSVGQCLRFIVPVGLEFYSPCKTSRLA